jgi:hypothetical protein
VAVVVEAKLETQQLVSLELAVEARFFTTY